MDFNFYPPFYHCTFLFMRVACSVEYNGFNFCGWQKQPDSPTIQGLIEQALFKIAHQKINTYASGRTDKGVHSLGQVFHFDTSENRPTHAWVKGVNAFLPDSIRIKWANIVDETFHARHSALEREYQYLLVNDQYNSAPFHTNFGWTYHNLNTDIKGYNFFNYDSLLISNGVHKNEIKDKGIEKISKQYKSIVNYIQSDLKW